MKKQSQKVYAFIDSQNLNLGVRQNIKHGDRVIYHGWDLDFGKFRRFLSDKYHVSTAFLFIGNLPGNEDLYDYLQSVGYSLVLKPTATYKDGDTCDNGEEKIKIKGNVDTDLVLYAAAKEFDNYDRAIIVTGDGDFLGLCEYLDEKDKLGRMIIPNKLRYSRLLVKFTSKFDYVSVNRRKLEKINKQKKTSIDPRDAHHGVARHGDNEIVANQNSKVNIEMQKSWSNKNFSKHSSGESR
jgi:uncharacterized LabA/DUF88 family protein